MYRIIESSDRTAIERLVGRRIERARAVEQRAASIVAAVRRRGDAALEAYARRFDGLDGAIELTPRELREGAARTPAAVRRAIEVAAAAIRKVAARQVPRPALVTTAPGVTIELRPIPFERAGCYVPGGRFPLVSTMLMTAIPAAAAGVGEIVAASPRPEPAMLAAAVEAGVARFFRVGGAQAIAALAYGTRRVPRVDKIVGPGNAWVAAAKRLVARDCDVDFEAGPTELVIITQSSKGSRGSRGSDVIVADLMAQEEHDPAARSILVTPDRSLARDVARRWRGPIVLTRDIDEAIALTNRMAPEHVACDDERTADGITNAGTIFVGRWSAPAAGDYATGSNHVLPTGGTARTRGGLNAADFMKIVAIQRVTRDGLRRIAPAALALAGAEGLQAHAHSIEVRL
jgi:histidinol dehydrogenase